MSEGLIAIPAFRFMAFVLPGFRRDRLYAHSARPRRTSLRRGLRLPKPMGEVGPMLAPRGPRR